MSGVINYRRAYSILKFNKLDVQRTGKGRDVCKEVRVGGTWPRFLTEIAWGGSGGGMMPYETHATRIDTQIRRTRSYLVQTQPDVNFTKKRC